MNDANDGKPGSDRADRSPGLPRVAKPTGASFDATKAVASALRDYPVTMAKLAE